mgnify:CR=1 FL=1
MTIPKGNLYDDLYFRYSVKEDSTALADTHILHNRPVPLHSSARLSLRLRVDTLENKQQYGIIRTQKGRRSWIGGTYRNGWIDGTIKELGNYTVGQDQSTDDHPVGRQHMDQQAGIRFPPVR